MGVKLDTDISEKGGLYDGALKLILFGGIWQVLGSLKFYIQDKLM